MRSMMLRRTPMFGDIMRDILEPYKYGPRMYDEDIGTRENPTVLTRGEWVERKFKAWRDEDGSYHEERMEDFEIPIKPELTD